jgi:hypothetical protein
MRWILKWEVESISGRTYIVSEDNDGGWGCSCPAWTRSARAREDCKHIKAVKSGLHDRYGVTAVRPLERGTQFSMPETGKVVINF